MSRLDPPSVSHIKQTGGDRDCSRLITDIPFVDVRISSNGTMAPLHRPLPPYRGVGGELRDKGLGGKNRSTLLNNKWLSKFDLSKSVSMTSMNKFFDMLSEDDDSDSDNDPFNDEMSRAQSMFSRNSLSMSARYRNRSQKLLESKRSVVDVKANYDEAEGDTVNS